MWSGVFFIAFSTKSEAAHTAESRFFPLSKSPKHTLAKISPVPWYVPFMSSCSTMLNSSFSESYDETKRTFSLCGMPVTITF